MSDKKRFIPFTIRRRFPSSRDNGFIPKGYSGVMTGVTGDYFNSLGNKFFDDSNEQNSNFICAVGNIAEAGVSSGYHINLACSSQTGVNNYFVLGFIGAKYVKALGQTGGIIGGSKDTVDCVFTPQEWEDFNYQTRFPIKVITTSVASAQALLSRDDAEYVSHIVGGGIMIDIISFFKRKATLLNTMLSKQTKWGFR